MLVAGVQTGRPGGLFYKWLYATFEAHYLVLLLYLVLEFETHRAEILLYLQ